MRMVIGSAEMGNVPGSVVAFSDIAVPLSLGCGPGEGTADFEHPLITAERTMVDARKPDNSFFISFSF
ncbi:MAG: hypothetical protein RSD74_01945, partial [Angelakisella sp.]